MLNDLGVLDVDLLPGPELAEALQRVGRQDEARTVVARYRDGAREKGQPWALARAERSLGPLAPEDAFRQRFETALQLHDRTPDTFEQARTSLADGSRLRRARHRARPARRSGRSR